MIKKSILLLVPLLLTALPTEAAYYHHDEASDCESRLEIAGEWLAFTPTFSQFNHVETAFDGALQSFSFIPEPDYSSNYRIEGIYTFGGDCGLDLLGRYTKYNDQLSEGAARVGGIAITGPIDLSFDYFNVEVLMRKHMPEYYNLNWAFGFGPKYVYFSSVEEFGQFTTVAAQTYVKEVGAIISLDGALTLPFLSNCFSVTGRFLAGLMACKTDFAIQAFEVDTNVQVADLDAPNIRYITTTTDARVGLSYNGFIPYLSCLKINLEGGYEFLRESFSEGAARISNVDIFQQSFEMWTNFTLKGPYVRLGLVF